jgi:hypothetical protein
MDRRKCLLLKFPMQWKGFKSLAKLTFITDPVKKVPIVLDMLFPSEWLDERDSDEPAKTNRQVQAEVRL